MDTALSVRACFRYGWQTFKKRPWFFAGVSLLIVVVSSILPSVDRHDPWFVIAGVFVVSFLLNQFIYLAGTRFTLKAYDDVEAARLEDLWYPEAYFRYLGISIITGVLVILGLILLIIPGIIVGAGLSLATYLVVDKGMGPVAAAKESWRITKGYRMKLFLLILTVFIVNFLGALAFIVGLLVSIPVSMFAFAHAYRIITNAAVPAGTTELPTVAAETVSGPVL
ncbi:MAG TPA: DUF975 family protein [Candidatus Paceibacterota bacterium]|jgi:hypothetical protein